jgi:DNA repair protein RadC
LILGSQRDANALLQHFGSLLILAQASVEQLLPFISRSKAIRLVSSLRMGAVTLREERQSITIDSPEIVAELCSEMRFLDRELLRVVLLNAKQHLIKVVTVSQGTVNESLAHPREIFKPVITHSAYSFVTVHNLCGATHKLCYVEQTVMCSVPTNYRCVERFIEVAYRLCCT